MDARRRGAILGAIALVVALFVWAARRAPDLESPPPPDAAELDGGALGFRNNQIDKSLRQTKIVLMPSIASPSEFAIPLTLTAAITSVNAGTIAGQIHFFDGATEMPCSPVTIAAGSAACVMNQGAVDSLTVGTHKLYATYGGSSTFAGTASATVSQVVQWTPAALPNIVAWFRADHGIHLNGATVSQWDDSSGATLVPNVLQATAANQPTFESSAGVGINAQADLLFSGNQWLWDGQTNNATSNLAAFVVEKTSSHGTYAFFAKTRTSAAGAGFELISTSTITEAVVFQISPHSAVIPTADVGAIAQDGQPHILGVYWGTGTGQATLWVDGYGMVNHGVTGTDALNTTDSLAVGAQVNGTNSSQASKTTGQIAEAVLASSQPSVSDLVSMRDYGHSRYGIIGTQTTVASSLNPSTSGTSVTFTCTATSQYGTPNAGMASVRDNGTQIGTCTVTSGSCTFGTSALAVGTHPITCLYQGSGGFTQSLSASLSQVVN